MPRRSRRRRNRLTPMQRAVIKAKRDIPPATRERLFIPYLVDAFKLNIDRHFIFSKKGNLEEYDDRILDSELTQIISKANEPIMHLKPSPDYSQYYPIIGMALVFIPIALFVVNVIVGALALAAAGVAAFFLYKKYTDMKKTDKDNALKKDKLVRQVVDQLNVGQFYDSDFTIDVGSGAMFLQISVTYSMGHKPNHDKYPNRVLPNGAQQHGKAQMMNNVMPVHQQPQTAIHQVRPMGMHPQPMNNQGGHPQPHRGQQPMQMRGQPMYQQGPPQQYRPQGTIPHNQGRQMIPNHPVQPGQGQPFVTNSQMGMPQNMNQAPHNYQQPRTQINPQSVKVAPQQSPAF